MEEEPNPQGPGAPHKLLALDPKTELEGIAVVSIYVDELLHELVFAVHKYLERTLARIALIADALGVDDYAKVVPVIGDPNTVGASFEGGILYQVATCGQSAAGQHGHGQGDEQQDEDGPGARFGTVLGDVRSKRRSIHCVTPWPSLLTAAGVTALLHFHFIEPHFAAILVRHELHIKIIER